MPIRGPHIGPAQRIRIGETVLACARGVDTHLVKDRLARFRREHRRYVAAQRQVAAVGAELRAAQARLAACGRAQDQALDRLADEAWAEGPRARNPFRRFGMPAPSRIARLPYADEVVAVRELVAAIRRVPRVDVRTVRAAVRAVAAASDVETALRRVAEIDARARDARTTRDALKLDWHAAYMALQRGARTAADDGAPHLHARLFAAHAPGGAKRRAE